MTHRISRGSFLLFCVASLYAGQVFSEETAAPVAERFFESRVRPILATRCLNCHGPQKQESGLRVDSSEALLRGGDSESPAVVPGKPRESLLVQAIHYDGDLQMPPDKQLSKDEVAAIETWVATGALWPKSAPRQLTLNNDERRRHAQNTHWAFQPILRPAAPQVSQADWISTPVDAFILAKLDEKGLNPSREATRQTLIRRATFDLWGLPPTPDEVATFLADHSPDAYTRLIDRLLASPRYGERWGRHWLDVARYADTRGYSFGKERQFPYAYTYRDYVTEALNADTPYDRFVLEQLAADQLALEDSTSLSAMGFLTVGRRFNNEHDDIDDRIDVMSRGLMGLTVSCARCHDHKYDAIPTEDYYSLYGVFASSQEPSELPLIGDPKVVAGYQAFKEELDKRQKSMDDFAQQKHAELLATSRSRVTDYLVRVVSNKPETLLQKLPFISLSKEELKPKLVERWRRYLEQHAKLDHPVLGPWLLLSKLPDDKFSSEATGIVAALKVESKDKYNPLVIESLSASALNEKIDVARAYGKLLEDAYDAWKKAGANEQALAKLTPPQQALAHLLLDDATPTAIPRDELQSYLTRADNNKYRELQKAIDSHQVNSTGAPARAMVLLDKPRPFDPQVFIRGNHARRGKRVPRQFPAVLSGETQAPFEIGSGRLELAKAITDSGNPLTARVIVNRIWMHHFGEPLVNTPSDFGSRSEPPSHPELLDFLAAELIQSGWSLKQLHRSILLSHAYRQESNDRPDCRAVDPENRLLWRMNRRRLEFEPLRDALLSVADRLDLQMGGRPADLIVQPFSRRRTVYGLIDRQDLPNLLRSFDFASPDQSNARRPRTTVPQQLLFMMNSAFVAEQAKALAARPEIVNVEDPAQRISAMYRLALSRDANSNEQAIGQAFIEMATSSRDSDNMSPWDQFAQLLLLTNEFMYVD